MANIAALFRSPTFLAKILELVLTAIATAMFMSDTGYLVTVRSKWAVVYGSLIGFMMISIIIIIGSVFNTALHRTLVLVITMCAAFLFFASGAIIIETWYHGKDATGYLIGSGVITFFNGLIYLGDFALTFFNYQ